MAGAVHLMGLRMATAAGAHVSTYRGAWRRCLWHLTRPLKPAAFPAIFFSLDVASWTRRLDAARLVRDVYSNSAVPPEAQKAFGLFAEDLKDAPLSFWARCITAWAVQTHVHSHEVLQRDLERHAVDASELRPPIFIVGLPRTGTTLLHHLLALDPESQCLRAYELMRCTRSIDGWLPQRWVDWLDWAKLALLMRFSEVMFPQWPHHHQLDANSPEECLFALQRSMPLDTHYRAHSRLLERYVSEEEIPLAAYQRYRLYLQQVQLRRGSEEKRFVLKGQLIHLQYLTQLRSVFPEAYVVWSHRPAEEVVGSLCSLRKSQQEVFLDEHPNKQEVGAGVLKYLSDALDRAGEALEQKVTKESIAERLVHVEYESLVADPVRVVEQIYESFGWQMSLEHRQAMEEYLLMSLAERSRALPGKERYHDASLSSYGLSGHLVREFLGRTLHTERFSELSRSFGNRGVMRHGQLFV